MNYKQCAKELLCHEKILIITHRNPDGDTVGSAAALCSALRRGGRSAYLFPNPQICGKLLAFSEEFFAPSDFEAMYTIAVDVADEGLFCEGFSGKADLCIDHHPSNSLYAKDTFLKSEKASCAEIIFELILNINTELSPEEATLLFIGLSTDTGNFAYSNTSAAAFRTASELVKRGADNYRVTELFFRKLSKARILLESMIYSTMTFHRDGKIAVAIVTQEMMNKVNATEDDLDDLAGLAGRVDGTIASITIRELANGSSKISLRSAKAINCNEVCAVFGGGGHVSASGCTIYNTPEKARDMLLNVIDEVWK